MADPVHFFLHVPKCAGTTVEAHFARTLGEGFLLAPRWRSPLRDVIGNRYPSLAGRDLSGVRLVSGHSLSASLAAHFPGRPVRESVLLRDPLSFQVSFYNYRWARHLERGQAKPPAFPVWRRSQRRNPIAQFLLSRYFGHGVPAIYALSTRARFLTLEAAFARFRFVGSWRRCSEAVAGISADLGVPGDAPPENVGRTRALRAEDLPEAERRAILTEHALDQLLFDRWADRGFDPARNPPDPQAAARALPARDGLAQIPADLESAIRRKLHRR